ncbi:hypothetical protein C475_01282 [Halosimplex carlsbadense 2-9-1]|uniref:HPr kinase n=1 Tax=Halosimplex carlsbadense 2-9-1 TaxID=797114 RepID=M0D4E1_9EURY|nr:hypothetical protein [Halosimplex carlsbadense]ELZ30325.1 hypothetical protein C475_01282 [Halosimplex carlsbadense 2-9-1]
MHYYSAYDLTIRSEFTLPELPPLPDEPASVDVEFRTGAVTPVAETVEAFDGRRIAASPGVCRLSYDSIGSFLVEGGERVVCDPDSEEVVGRDLFRRLLENEMLGLVLHQRDHLVLHASAVSIGGNGVVFLGPRGAGKSTTATAMQLEGYSMLEDDVVGIRFGSGTPMVVPGVPQLRLREDAAAALDVTDRSTPSEESWYEKRYLSVSEIPDPVPLTRCFKLQRGDGLRFEELSGRAKLLELVSRTHARGLLSDTEQSRTHFEHCSRVVDTAAFRVLKRPQDHDRLPELVEKVAEDALRGRLVEG